MVTLKALDCSKCGAPLTLSGDVREASCPYCGAKTLVSGASRPPQFPFPPHSKDEKRPNVGLILSVVGFLTIGFIGGLFFIISTMTESALDAAKSRGGPAASALDALKEKLGGLRFRGQPLLGKVNGDEVLDIVGECDTTTATEATFCAFDGRDGKLLYRLSGVTKEQLDGQSLRGVAKSSFVIVDQLGKVQAYRLSDGSPLWAGLISDRARKMCLRDEELVLFSADDERFAFELGTGKKRSLGPAKRHEVFACEAIWSERSEANPAGEIVGWSEFGGRGLPSLHSIEGLSAHRALIPSEGEVRFMLGAKSKGTAFPMVAAVQAGKVVWQDAVPGIDPLLTKTNVTTQLAAFANGILVVPYDLKESEGTRMAALDGATGKRLWDIEVHKDSQVSSGIAVTNDAVYYATWTELFVFGLKDGQLRFVIGKSLK